MEYSYAIYHKQTLQKIDNGTIYSITHIFDVKTIKTLWEFEAIIKSEWKELEYYLYIDSILII